MPQIDRDQRLGQVVDRLAKSGYRMSSQRSEILRALIDSAVHPSAEDVYVQVKARFPNASLATVYKTIDALKTLDEVRMVSIAAGRAHYDVLDLSDHPHVVCTRCGRTEDVHLSEREDHTCQAGKNSGYEITEERLQFFGLCPACKQSV